MQTNLNPKGQKFNNRQIVVIVGLVTLSIICLWWVVGQRKDEAINDTTNWRENEPLTYPYTVATLGNHQVILTEVIGQPAKVKVAVNCTDINASNFNLTLTSLRLDGHSNSSSVGAIGACGQVGALVIEQIVDLSQYHTGDSLFVTLTEPNNQPSEATSIFMIGTDGRLRSGLFSVWVGS